MAQQPGWRWCYKCGGLFVLQNTPQGVCPNGGGLHDATKSGRYMLQFGDGLSPIPKGQQLASEVPALATIPGVLYGAQGAWRWCKNCQGLFYSGNSTQGVCPAKHGGSTTQHDGSASGHYMLWMSDGYPYGQGLWRWCRKCQGFFYSGHPTVCPDGGAHDGSASGMYACPWDIITIPTQYINFDNGVTVHGNFSLTLWPNGGYRFAGSFHDSGLLPYGAAVILAMKSPSATVLTFSHQANLAGDITPGPSDNYWNNTGTNSTVASEYNRLSSGYSWHWKAHADLDLGSLWSSIKSAIGTIEQVVSVVGSVVG
jgi:hypothetical protein